MNNYRLLAITSAIVGTLFDTTFASALTFSLNNYDSSSGTFSYDVTLAADETLEESRDYLFLTNLAGITNTSAVDPYTTLGFDTTSADFEVSTTINATDPRTYENVISLTSSSPLGSVNYDVSYNSLSNELLDVTALGPSVTPVPFEPSVDIGLFIIFGIFGLNYCRKKAFMKSK